MTSNPGKTRRRGAALESAILDAGWDLLIEAGYEGFTIDAVAEKSSTARSVLYRRWPSRPELFKAVITNRGEATEITLPDTGSLRSDLLALLTEVNERRSRIIGLLAAQLGAYFDEIGSPEKIRQWFLPDRPTTLETLLKRSVARGELDAMPPPSVATLPVDLLRYHILMTMGAVQAQVITEIVDDIFLPLVTGRTGAPV